jgi:hypothetical protein
VAREAALGRLGRSFGNAEFGHVGRHFIKVPRGRERPGLNGGTPAESAPPGGAFARFAVLVFIHRLNFGPFLSYFVPGRGGVKGGI